MGERAWRGGLLLLSVLLSSTTISESRQYSGPIEPVPRAYFAMHIHHAASGTAWPAVSFADWRLWDAGVSWRELEPERGKFDFTLLDQYVKIAAEHRVEILLTLGLTPSWASSRPDEDSGYARGNAAEPQSLADWEDYVRVVATRYKGVIHEYEIWNEPNARATFTGSVDAMLVLTRCAYRVLKTVDPKITVVSPSATADTGVLWLQNFVARGGCQYTDVIGYHFYVTPARPESMIPLIQRVRGLLQRSDCAQKPLWNTESGWTKPKYFSGGEEAAAYVMRTYLLNWLMGVQRCYWYAWDNHNWSTLDLTSSVALRPTKAGRAYGIIQLWMLGTVVRSCRRDHSGLWTCYLEREGSVDHVVWRDEGTHAFTIPPPWKARTLVTWTGELSRPDLPIMVGPAPVFLSTNTTCCR